MSTQAMNQQLATAESFARAVKAPNPYKNVAIGSFVGAVVCLVINLLQSGEGTRWNWMLIARVFFKADALDFSGPRAARGEFFRYVWVYGPMVLIPLAIIFLVVYVVTRRSHAEKLFTAFQERGWVGMQAPTGLSAKVNRAQIPLSFFSHPSLPDDEFVAAAAQYQQYIDGLDRKTKANIAGQAVAAGALQGTSAATLSPQLPSAITVGRRVAKANFAALVPSAPNAKKVSVQILPLKS